jgi:hypothetical protein
MAKRKTRVRVEAVPDPSFVSKTAMCSVWEGERVLDGFASIGRVEAELSKAQDNPMDRPRQFEKARQLWKHQWFVREIIRMRYNFYTYGFAIKSEEKKPSKALKSWERNCRRMYRRYAREAFYEFLLQDNVVGLWRQQGGRPPLVIEPERCELNDLFGNEILKIRHGISQEHITTIGAFSRSEEKEFKKVNNELKLDHENKTFGFDILRRERMGAGFGVPSVTPIFTTAANMTSLEVGDASLAAACRMVMELHLMGHEIKGGPHAGNKAHFWNENRAKAFEKSIKGKLGHNRLTANFDHKIVQAANWPDPKILDEKRYASGITRMAIWGMPLGQMLLNKSLNPFLLPMLKYQAIAERELMAEHLYTVFTEGLGAPEDMKCVWSNRCFSDPRVAADLLKTGLASGPLSQGTFLEESGFDKEEERENKAEEAGLPKTQTTPIFDAAHGDPNKKQPGRKPGTRDGEGGT